MGVAQAIDLAPEDRNTVLMLLERHLPGTEAWAYGSRVKWTSRPQSDLDLVVFATEDQRRFVGDLREAFEESNLPFRVDLFVWGDVPEEFRERIRAEHVVLGRPNGAERSAVRLGDCIVMNAATYSPSKDAWPFVNYLDTGSITDNRVDSYQYLNLEGGDTLPTRARRRVNEGDIVYSTVRPNKRHFGLLRELPENPLVSTGFAVFRGRERYADTGFIFRYLTQDQVVNDLHTIAEHSTSAYPSIRPSDIERVDISLPPLPEQSAIAHVLGTLDDKIELNRRMNETLEGMARALFKSWFVDFDPVCAKMEGRDTGLPPEIADLFPDRMVDSEMGEVPEGWEVSTLGGIAAVRRKGADPASVASDTPYIGLANMPRGSISLADWGEIGSVSSRKSVFTTGDILFGKLRPYFHKVGIAPVDGLCSTDIVVLSARDPRVSQE